MTLLLRHSANWGISVILGLLLLGNQIDYSSNGPAGGAAMGQWSPLPGSADHGRSGRVAIPFTPAALIVVPDRQVVPVLDEGPTSKDRSAGSSPVARGGDRSCRRAQPLADHAGPSRTHLYCVYRL